MSHTTSRSVGGDKLAVFLQQTLGTLAEGYVVSLAQLNCLKEERHQKEQLSLKEELKAKDKVSFGLEEQLRKKDNELAAIRKKQKKVEADLVLANTKNLELVEKNMRLPELEKQLREQESMLTKTIKKIVETEELFDLASSKLKDMEDAVSKLLSKVTIPSTLIGYLSIGQRLGRIEEWHCREGGLLRPNHYDVIKVNSGLLGWSVNGFLMSKLKKEGDDALEDDQIAKYVNLDR
jgi:hypothetical protein